MCLNYYTNRESENQKDIIGKELQHSDRVALCADRTGVRRLAATLGYHQRFEMMMIMCCTENYRHYFCKIILDFKNGVGSPG